MKLKKFEKKMNELRDDLLSNIDIESKQATETIKIFDYAVKMKAQRDSYKACINELAAKLKECKDECDS